MLCEECCKTFNLDCDDLLKFLHAVGPQRINAEPLPTPGVPPTTPNRGETLVPPAQSTDEDSSRLNRAEHPKGSGPSSKRLKLSPSPELPVPTAPRGPGVGSSSNGDETLVPPTQVDPEVADENTSSPEHPTGGKPLAKQLKPPPGSHDLICCPMVSCVVCLGLLEQQYLQHLSSAITEHVRQSNLVGMETYSLSIHVPISLSVRRIGIETCTRAIKRCSPAGSLPTLSSSDHATVSAAGNISESDYAKEKLKWQLRQLLDVSLAPLRWHYESPLLICLSLDHQSSLRDCIGVKKLRPKLFPRPKKHWRKKYQPTLISRQPVEKALDDLTDTDMAKEGYFLSTITSPCSHKVEVQHKSVFVAGRYNKYSRTLPQTPWILDGMRKVDTSVQELICPQIVAAFRASDVRFSSSGREDVDVLMLGNGRPFLLELVNPLDVSTSDTDLLKIEGAINTGTKLIAVKQLKRVSKDSSMLLKQGEEEKKKIYSALVWAEEELTQDRLKVLDENTNLILKQKTPIRVLHRRTLAVREKVVYSMTTQLLNSHHFRLRLVTQAGTYIKEFVHGDFGRTQPNIGTLLGCDADILSLDVLEVQLQWPPDSSETHIHASQAS